MNRSTDVLIIGGGVIGCSIAYHLAKDGVEVMAVDQGEVGAQASSTAAGLLAPLLPFSSSPEFVALLLASFALFPALVTELEEVSGVPIQFEQTGALRTASSPKGLKRLQQHIGSWRSWGFQASLLGGGEVGSLEPQLSPAICGAVYAPEESQVKASALVKAFAMAAFHKGATLVLHTQIVDLLFADGKVTGALTAQGDRIACNHLVVATGAWSARGGDWLMLEVPVRPLRGQVLSLRQPSEPLRHIVFGEGIYLAPKADGTVLVGATKDDVGFNTETTPEGVAWLRAAAARLMPSLGGCELVSAWAGLRPKTPDGQPILGTVPSWGNVTLAAGHNAFGVTLSPITGRAISQLVMTARTPEIIHPFSPLRFTAASPKTAAILDV